MSTGSEWQALRRGLEAMAERVAEEIRAYPRPITACDAQFNHLLELRRQLPHELDRLRASAQDPTATVAHFVATSPCGTSISAELVQPSISEPPRQPVDARVAAD